MPPMPPPFTPEDADGDVTEVHDTTEPQESDAHDIAVPLPVSTPFRTCSSAGPSRS